MENVQGLVEKWEQSGLLEQVNNKENMSLLLESAAYKLVEIYSTEEYKDEFRAAGPLIFPIIQRTFRDRIYDVQVGAKPTQAVSRFVGTSQIANEDDEVTVCKEASKGLGELLSSKEGVSTTITSIDIQLRKTGFHLLVNLL